MAITIRAFFGGGQIITSDEEGDLINGTAFADRGRGRGGDDTINGGNGNDSLYGGAGNDRVAGGLGSDFVSGGRDNDIVVGYAALFETIDRVNSQGQREVGVAVSEVGEPDLSEDLVYGGDGNDLLIGGYGADALFGGAGDDNIIGFNGSAQVTQTLDAQGNVTGGGFGVGRSGDMDLSDDFLSGGRGNDFLAGGGGNDELSGGQDNDILIGDEGRDVLRGGSGNDELHGDELNSEVIGDDDILFGGAGADRFFFGGLGTENVVPVFGTDVVRDFNRNAGDTIELVAFAGLSFEALVVTRTANLDIDGDGVGDGRSGVVITSSAFAEGDSITVVGQRAMQASDFVFAAVSES